MEQSDKELRVGVFFRNQYQNHPRQCVIIAFWLIAILLGIIHAWTGRHAMCPDGVSYLDIGDAYFRGDWNMALNAYWSPFYSWLLGLIMFLLKPSPYYEFTVVHIVNFVIYLFALASFHFFLIGLARFHRNWVVKISKDGYVALSEEILLALGYALFIWSSLHLISIEVVTPDMCVSAFIYLISGLLLRIRMGVISWLRFIILGIILGFSYLSKSSMFIVSFIILGSSVFLLGNLRKAIPRTVTALIVFLLIISPFISILSKTKGRFTFGDAGKINYLWFVNDDTPYGYHLEDARLKHPLRLLSSTPKIYEFEMPIHGTYPLHYDPSYWLEGIKLKFDLRKQISALMRNIKGMLKGYKSDIIIYGVLLFFFMGYRRRLFIKDMLEYWFLIIPAVLALAMYSLVLVLPRYIGPFLVILWMGIFSTVHLRESQETKKWMTNTIVCMLLLISIPVGYSAIRPTYSLFKYLIKGEDSRVHVHWQIAEALKKMGFHPGDKMCYIGRSYDVYWARLAKLQIVAEIQGDGNVSPYEASYLADPIVIESLAKIKVKAIVAQITSEKPSSLTNWKQIGNTNYYVYILKR